MEDKDIKKITDEVERHIDVLKEDFDSKVQLIAEQYDSVIKRLDSLDTRITNVEKNIEIMKVDIIFIKQGLKQKVDLEEFTVLENRVAMLEAKLNR
jgi:BMFP domain-containing protein YqiC